MVRKERGARYLRRGVCGGLGKGAPEAAAAPVACSDSGGGVVGREERGDGAGRRLGSAQSARARLFFF